MAGKTETDRAFEYACMVKKNADLERKLQRAVELAQRVYDDALDSVGDRDLKEIIEMLNEPSQLSGTERPHER